MRRCRINLSNRCYHPISRVIELFRSATGTSKGILPTLVTTCGLKRNANAAMITNVVTLDDHFRG